MNIKSAFEYLSGKKQFDVTLAREYALRGGEEGIVLLENKNKTLPLKSGEKVAFFGRMQKHYIV
jgi:beta-glucosidase-like glycosyl hydrolase